MNNPHARPVSEADRILSLDVLRGFALLGILLLNIVGMGMHSASYFSPDLHAADGISELPINLAVWATVDVLFEGAMRALFSMLFGASIVLLATGRSARGAPMFYRRNAWLLAFGLVDAYVLFWTGDILVTYALAGFVLFRFRNASPRKLLISALVVLVLHTGFFVGWKYSLAIGQQAAVEVASNPELGGPGASEMAEVWYDFESNFVVPPGTEAVELQQRRASYPDAFLFNAGKATGMILVSIPTLLLWDALIMMLIGMALFKQSILDASKSTGFYVKLMLIGFGTGFAINSWEVYQAARSGFQLLETFPYLHWTYHLGRLGMAFGWMGLILFVCRKSFWAKARHALAAVGRMALSNYLMHSVFALVLFSGAGFALVGEFDRWMLYPIVASIWVIQLIVSPWWLSRFQFGPCEWLWRGLSYGRIPALRRTPYARTGVLIRKE